MADLVPMSQAATTSLVTTLQNTDLFALAREDITSETGYRSKVSRVDTMAKKVAKETDYSDLQTTSKNLIGAINEVNTKASQFDNMTDNASGSIATFADGGDDIPVSEYECDIVAQQASGTPTPVSPLPITGFSQADISVSGKNLWNETTRNGYYSVSTGIYQGVTGQLCTQDYIPVKPNTTYYCYKGSNANIGECLFYDENKTYIDYITPANFNNHTFTTPNNCYYITFNLGNGYGTTYGNDISINYPSSDAQYHAYTGNLYTVAFGQTIYGGKLVYKDSQWSIEATHNIVDLGSLDWGDLDGNGLHSSTDISDMINGWYAQDLSDYLCEIFTPKSQNVGWSSMVNGEYGTNQKYLRVKWTDISSGADFKTFVTGKYLVYELETPVIIPITSSTRVKTISGNNNIFSNTGDNIVKYFTENADSLAELIKAFVL